MTHCRACLSVPCECPHAQPCVCARCCPREPWARLVRSTTWPDAGTADGIAIARELQRSGERIDAKLSDVRARFGLTAPAPAAFCSQLEVEDDGPARINPIVWAAVALSWLLAFLLGAAVC